MNLNTVFFRSFKLLFGHRPLQLILLSFLTLYLGIASGFSVVLLIPLLEIITQADSRKSNQMVDFISDLAQKVNLELNLENILIIYILVLSTTALVTFANGLLNTSYRQSLIFEVRRRLFRKIIMTDWSKLNNKGKTDHLQVLTQEIPTFSNYFFLFLKLLTSLIMISSLLGWAFVISYKFTIVILGLGTVLFFAFHVFLRRAFQFGKDHLDSYKQLLKYIDDFWLTIKIAKVHSSELFYFQKFDQASSSMLEVETKLNKNHLLPQLIYKLIGLFFLVIVVYVGYSYELLPLTSFFVLIILFGRIYPQFSSINSDLNQIISKFPSVKLVMKLDDELSDGVLELKRKEKLTLTTALILKDLSFGYSSDKQLFKNLHVTIPAYSITGVLGSSGRGKTSLLDIIAGIQTSPSGEVLVDGVKLDKRNWPLWRNGIGYLPQDSFFVDGSLRENIIWDCPNEVTDSEIKRALKKVNALHLIDRFSHGLDEYIVNYPFQFSGGERQRLALCRVLLRDPQILLLDEATSSLDEENETQIMNLLKELKEKITIVLITHKNTAAPWLDQVIRLGA